MKQLYHTALIFVSFDLTQITEKVLIISQKGTTSLKNVLLLSKTVKLKGWITFYKCH